MSYNKSFDFLLVAFKGAISEMNEEEQRYFAQQAGLPVKDFVAADTNKKHSKESLVQEMISKIQTDHRRNFKTTKFFKDTHSAS